MSGTAGCSESFWRKKKELTQLLSVANNGLLREGQKLSHAVLWVSGAKEDVGPKVRLPKDGAQPRESKCLEVVPVLHGLALNWRTLAINRPCFLEQGPLEGSCCVPRFPLHSRFQAAGR